ncbi:uncharacterized protein LOC105212036 [Zeugodacus cucurbitae]|uniref:uncharacterized protein LOC105212036 n=1 Tax=Zeugodacus cucurbitae TaxID=28588 RepID=UPI000596A096|nr:uncharacterized protein LOC105212036 [Zeugodacus cucurbitae]
MADTELILKIINAVKQHDCLWNVHSSEYAKRDKLEKAWHEVSVNVGRPDVFCREKWRNVRTGFLRSIQYNTNIRSDYGDSTEDLPTPRRKRFYLYDEMKFILPSTETIGQTKKRRKHSRATKTRISLEDPSGDNGDTSNIPTSFTTTDDTKHYNNNDTNQNTNVAYPEILNELQLTANSSKSLTRQSDVGITMKVNQQSPPLRVDEEKSEQMKHEASLNVSSGATKCEVGNNTILGESFNVSTNRGECDNRDEEQLLAFFRGNIDDILSLPRHKQRLFKRRMLELIDDLHRPENGISNRYCS